MITRVAQGTHAAGSIPVSVWWLLGSVVVSPTLTLMFPLLYMSPELYQIVPNFPN